VEALGGTADTIADRLDRRITPSELSAWAHGDATPAIMNCSSPSKAYSHTLRAKYPFNNRLPHAHQHIERSGFSGAVGSDECIDRPARHAQGQGPEGECEPEGFPNTLKFDR